MMNKLAFPLKPLFIFGLLMLLSACAPLHNNDITRDGPPPHDVDASKIPDAVPKEEPYSRYGNKTYKVRGKKYHVLKTHKGYHARGIASWYGTKFHHHRTSSGEPYNMYAMTAASRNLPIPSYVEVTNLHNGRKAIVKVNDRGPFEKNRLIDLSYVAAKKLGVTGHGTAYVEVRAIDSKKYRTHKAYHAPMLASQTRILPDDNSQDMWNAATDTNVDNLTKNSHLFVQVGAFSQSTNAYRLREKLAQIINEPVYIKKIKQGQQPTYRVQIGPLVSLNSGKNLVAKLKAAGIHQSMSVIQ